MNKTYLGIDIGSTQICAIIAQKDEHGELKALGSGVSKSQGLKKGIITNIDLASNCIKSAVEDAKRIAGQHYEEALVSISGAYTKSIDSSGIVNVPNHEIGIKEINRAMQMADHNANIPNEYEKLHVLPFTFKVDDQDSIEDPLGMNGSRLEVSVHIITVQKSSLNNIRKTVKNAGIKIDNIVLSGYASSIATLNEDEKELGVGLIDMGGATCNMVIHVGNSIRYNNFLSVGSLNITSDLSMALHTPIPIAEDIKIKYGFIGGASDKLINLPVLGDENTTHEVTMDTVSNVLYARVEETLMLLAKRLEDSGFKGKIGAGLVLTGGFTKLKGLKELATPIFDNIPIRIAKPKEIEGMFDSIKDQSFSTAIGLILYGSGGFTPYEIDSNKKMRYKDETFEKRRDNVNINLAKEDSENTSNIENEILENIRNIGEQEKRTNFFKKAWIWLTQLF
ncbi:MAG: cell division protein FtsA [Proteobacteria bacterium]|nr:MAG: cell division protein FtsA [Pseudomonadota bacterium]